MNFSMMRSFDKKFPCKDIMLAKIDILESEARKQKQ